MGTNYYAKGKDCSVCKHTEGIHLGRAAGGWRFNLQYNRGEFYKNVEEMKGFFAGKVIENECGEIISNKDFWKMVEERQGGKYDEEWGTRMIDGYMFSDGEFS